MVSRKEIKKNSARLFKVCFTNGRLDDQRLRDLVTEISERKPRGWQRLLDSILKLTRLEVQKYQAFVESAVPLSTITQTQLESDLRVKYGNDITIEFTINPELLGGLRVKIGSDVWDGSVRSRIAQLQQQFS